ncbi:MAG: Lrp/AsnC family transcriptional regulator [Chloroflexi bacterium]|nr:Lrp/AsnC family transcriptional regulator [Chloroflexota bacterium]
MSLNFEKLLDLTGRKILKELQENARRPFSEIGRRVGLTTPAVTERVRRMEEAGLITRYRAEVDLYKLGYPLIVFIRLYTSPQWYNRVLKIIGNSPEVLECHHVTGDESFILKIVAASTTHLETFINQFSHYGKTTTSIVLSSPVKGRSVDTLALSYDLSDPP